jgi:hypothetical protein
MIKYIIPFAVTCALLVALVMTITPNAARALNPRCVISWLDWNQNNTNQPINDQGWVCTHKNYAHCQRYYHPNCPNCYIEICFVSTYIFCRNHSCMFDPFGNYPLSGNQVALPCGSQATYYDWCVPDGNSYAWTCAVVCANCAYPWPPSVTQQIDQDITDWLAGRPVFFQSHHFNCDCTAGDCTG